MVRLQVQLTEHQVGELRKLSLVEGVSIAQLIRQSIDEQLLRQTASSRTLHLERLRQRVGRFHSGLGDLATEHDRYLNDALNNDGDIR